MSREENNALKKDAALLSVFEKVPVIKAKKIHNIIFLLQCLGVPFGFNFPSSGAAVDIVFSEGTCYSKDLQKTLDGLIAMGCIRQQDEGLRATLLTLTLKGIEFLEIYRTYAKLFNIQTINVPTCLLEQILQKKDLAIEAAVDYAHLRIMGMSPEETKKVIKEGKTHYLSHYLEEAEKLLKSFIVDKKE